MKKKKGFTLIELLAVIAILAILVIVAVPNVMNMFKNAKKQTFVTQAKQIFGAAEKKYMSDQLEGEGSTITYCHSSAGTNDNKLDLSGNKNVYYKIVYTDAGVTSFTVNDGTYTITKADADIQASDLTDDITTPYDAEDDEITCTP